MKIFIAGGAGGLGTALTTSLRENGHDVLPTRRIAQDGYRQADLLSENPRIFFHDAAEYEAVIINAGVGLDGVFAVQPDQEIEHMLSVNLLAGLRLAKWYVRQRLRTGGIILFISSIAGTVGMNGLVAYSATKAGQLGAVRALARELGSKFRVNALCPGFIETAMTKDLSEARRAGLVRRTPLGRLATVDDIVPVAKFLLSPDARWITGQAIIADGGFSC